MNHIREKIISQEEFDIKVCEAFRTLYKFGIKPKNYQDWMKKHEEWIKEFINEVKLSI